MKPGAPMAERGKRWEVRAGDKCMRVGCDKTVASACLPHQFAGCEEHMADHDTRCVHAKEVGADG